MTKPNLKTLSVVKAEKCFQDCLQIHYILDSMIWKLIKWISATKYLCATVVQEYEIYNMGNNISRSSIDMLINEYDL